jgi:hypothetical protein
MSTVKAKNIKVPNSAGTLEATLSFDGVNVVSDKPINADIKPSLNATGTAPVYGCRAWVNFDGTKDSTGAASTANTARFIRASGNVSSVVRNSTGDYTVNFTVAMPDANYSVSTQSSAVVVVGQANEQNIISLSTTSMRFRNVGTGTDLIDRDYNTAIIFR